VPVIPGLDGDPATGGAGSKISRTNTSEFQHFSRVLQDLCLFQDWKVQRFNLRPFRGLFEPEISCHGLQPWMDNVFKAHMQTGMFDTLVLEIHLMPSQSFYGINVTNNWRII